MGTEYQKFSLNIQPLLQSNIESLSFYNSQKLSEPLTNVAIFKIKFQLEKRQTGLMKHAKSYTSAPPTHGQVFYAQ